MKTKTKKKILEALSEKEIRNICWNCNNYFSIQKKNYLPKEKGQKQYIKCNYCNKINHN